MSEKSSKKVNLKKKLQKIKVLLTDVDGVLTDEGMYYTENGAAMKRFNVKDGMGASLLRAAGYSLGMITSDVSLINRARGEKMKMEHIVIGSYEKLNEAKKICAERGWTLENVAFIGDDVNDLDLLMEAGFSAAPKNAVPQVKKVVDYICERKGGDGAYREIAEMLLAMKPKVDVIIQTP